MGELLPEIFSFCESKLSMKMLVLRLLSLLVLASNAHSHSLHPPPSFVAPCTDDHFSVVRTEKNRHLTPVGNAAVHALAASDVGDYVGAVGVVSARYVGEV